MFKAAPSYHMIPNSKGEWISEGELHFYSEHLGATIVVPTYSTNNLASIPRGFRSLFPVNGPHRPAAALHDYLYEKKGKGIKVIYDDVKNNSIRTEYIDITREEADKIFLEAMLSPRIYYFNSLPIQLQDAMLRAKRADYFLNQKPLVGKLQSQIMYRAVRIGGGLYWS